MRNDELNSLREEIDNIDRYLIKYFEERARISRKIGTLKQKSKSAVRDFKREQEIIKQRSGWLEDATLTYESEAFMRAVISGSRRLQYIEKALPDLDVINMEAPDPEKTIAYQGLPGSYSEKAALIFTRGDEKKLFYYSYFEDVFKAVIKKDCYGVVPVENSINGGVAEVMDLLKQYECHIVKEIKVEVKHCLLGIKDSSLSDIKTVYSHPQAIEQSRLFIQKNGLNAISTLNTAESASMISEKNDKTSAAIASRRAGELYGLKVLTPNIQNVDNNITRFVVIAKKQEVFPDADKISITFSLKNESGSLCNVLTYFQKYNLNMLKIESRPRKDEQWAYNFYIDFEGTYLDKNTTAALSAIAEEVHELIILGFYGAENIHDE